MARHRRKTRHKAKRRRKSSKRWIQKALGTKRRRLGRGRHHRKAVRVEPAHRGALHRQLGIAGKKKIPMATLRKYRHAAGELGKRIRLALTLRRLGKHKRKHRK